MQDGYRVVHEFTVIARNEKGAVERTFEIEVTDNTQKPQMATVPELTGATQSTAVRRLTRVGLAVRVERVESDEPEGEVLAQSPAAGTELVRGDVVTITVSAGPAEQLPPSIVSLDLYAHATDAAGSFGARIGENGRELRDGAWWVPASMDQKGQRIRLCAAIQRSDGRAFYQNEQDWPDDVALSWETSNAAVAVVTSIGVVVATGDGDATITARAESGAAASINVHVTGQAGRYPVRLDVVDEDGVAYGDERITYSKIDAPSIKLYARVVFNDESTASNCPAAVDFAPDDEILATLAWSTTNTEKGYINNLTGVFVPRGYATLKAVAQVSGGDETLVGGIVEGYVWIIIDSGDYAQALPANSLHVRVTYEMDEDHTAFERDFTLDELQAIENAQATYTLTRDEGEYITASAQGIYLTTLLAHVRKSDGENGENGGRPSQGIDPDDLYGMRLAANDGVNPGLITADFLFQPRYYLPNYEFGANTADAVLVYPMFAYASDWRDSQKGARKASADYSALDGGTCFRLLFGSVGTHDGTPSKSLKYINTVTFILKGAPPAQPGGPDDSKSGEPGGPDGPVESVPAAPGGTTDPANGEPGTSGDGMQPERTQPGGPQEHSGEQPQGENGEEASPGEGASAGERDEASGVTAAPEAAEDAEQSDAADADAAEVIELTERAVPTERSAEAKASQSFEIYQVMSRAKTNFQYEDWVNPYLPWAPPLFIIAAALGALTYFVSYRRELAAPRAPRRPA